MPFKCAFCSYTSKALSKVKRHEICIHSKLRPWKCNHSGFHYAAKVKCDLNQHLQSHETNPELRQPHCCTFKDCVYRAATKSDVDRHVKRWHTQDRTRNFTCSICSSRFYEKPKLKVHIQSHVKEKRFQCRHCSFSTHN